MRVIGAVIRKIVTVGTNRFVVAWNNHRIPLKGIPNNMAAQYCQIQPQVESQVPSVSFLVQSYNANPKHYINDNLDDVQPFESDKSNRLLIDYLNTVDWELLPLLLHFNCELLFFALLVKIDFLFELVDDADDDDDPDIFLCLVCSMFSPFRLKWCRVQTKNFRWLACQNASDSVKGPLDTGINWLVSTTI